VATIDDKDGTPKSEIRIVESAGVVSGKIEKILDKDAKPGEKCVECTDERKDKPLCWAWKSSVAPRRPKAKTCGRAARFSTPRTASNYTLRLTPIEGGKKLEVRGSIGFFTAPRPGPA
jgi:hypothetical protein